MQFRTLFSLAAVMIVAGGILLLTGLFAMSDVTPLASMDCGCGGQTQCITKLGFLDRGGVLMVAGSFLGAGTLLFSGMGLRRLAGTQSA
jgi:hypothetical protein